MTVTWRGTRKALVCTEFITNAMSDPSPWVQSHCMILHNAECFLLESNNEIFPSDRPWMNPPLSSLSFSLSPSFSPPSSLTLSSQSDIFPIDIRRKVQCRENKSFLFLMVKEKILRPKKKWNFGVGLGSQWMMLIKPGLKPYQHCGLSWAMRMSCYLLSCDLTEKGSLSTCYTSECFHSLPLCPWM